MTQPLPAAAILILAAGKSSRMRGADKLLEKVDGQTLIRRQVLVALATGLPVWVALPPDIPQRAAAIQDLDCTLVHVGDADLGISRSIIAGNQAIPAHCSMILWLADLPDVTSGDFQTLLTVAKSAPTSIVRATSGSGKPGHPVLFPKAIRAELANLSGDEGARAVLGRHVDATVFVPLPDQRALTDLDTPEDWSLWRANNPDRN